MTVADRVLQLTRRQRKILEEFADPRKVGRGLAYRVRVVLSWAQGLSITQTGRLLGLARGTVRTWRKRWVVGIDAFGNAQEKWMHKDLRLKIRELLGDEPRLGAPVKYQAEEVCQIIALACKSPPEVDMPVSHRSARDLREAIIKEGIVAEISKRTVGRILK